MPMMKYWDGSTWIPLDANNADTVGGQHASDFAPISHVGSGGISQHALATTTTAGFMSPADKTKSDTVISGAEPNQNAFSNLKVGSTTIASEQKTDTLEMAAGAGITLTGDAVLDKVTVAFDVSYLIGKFAEINAQGRVNDSELLGGLPSSAFAKLNANNRVEDSERLQGKTLSDLDGRYDARGTGGGGTVDAALTYSAETVVVTATAKSKVTNPISNYDPDNEVMIVFQNSIFMQIGKDYTYNTTDKTINKVSGSWAIGTVFDFVVFKTKRSNSPVIVDQQEDCHTIPPEEDNCPDVQIPIPSFEWRWDGLNVFCDGRRLFKGIDFQLSADGMKIEFLGGRTGRTGERYDFVTLKNMINFNL